MAKITIGRRFCGPPQSGNGGYVSGLLARDIRGPATSVLRARIPLDIELDAHEADGGMRLVSAEAALIGEVRPTDGTVLPTPPAPPSLADALAAGLRFVGLVDTYHPVCFTCSPTRDEGDALRIFAGQLDGAPQGHLACVWTPHAAFGDAEGLVETEHVWAALDCPGYFAWVVKAGRHGALLGTMTGEVLRRPHIGEACIITAWPLEREGRKAFSGVALFSADGELLARGHQVWITMSGSMASVSGAVAD